MQYMIHSTGKYCELTHLFSVTVNPTHPYLHTVHTVYCTLIDVKDICQYTFGKISKSRSVSAGRIQ